MTTLKPAIVASSEKPWRVVTPHGVAWLARFKSEDAAWGRLLSINGRLMDTPANRATILSDGWKVKKMEPPGYDLGADLGESP